MSEATMSNEERDSQLSAMFDGELPQAECELLARRLARDEVLQARWSRYAMISAAFRAERNERLDSPVARRVRAALHIEETFHIAPVDDARRARSASRFGAAGRWVPRLAGAAAVAASVALVSVLWLQSQPSGTLPFLAQSASTTASQPEADAALTPVVDQLDEPDSYVVPMTQESSSAVPVATLANYVVAHSEFSTPLSRRALLSAFIGSEAGGTGSAPTLAAEESSSQQEAAQELPSQSYAPQSQ